MTDHKPTIQGQRTEKNDMLSIAYKHQTILNWCNKDKVEHFLIRMRCMIPKTSLMEYLAADGFHAINAESKAYILVRNRK